MTRPYGLGTLSLRKTKRHPKGQWWLRYVAGSRRITEKSGYCECHDSGAKAKAEKKLLKQIGKAEAGTLPSARAGKTLVSDLAELMFEARRTALIRKIPENLPEPTRVWREANAEKLLRQIRSRWTLHLKDAFGDRKAAFVTTEDLNRYIVKRHDEGAKNATINRELALLRRAFRIGYNTRPRLVPEVPFFPERLMESPRTGHTDDSVFPKVLAAIPEPGLRAMVLVAYRLGFRKSELHHLLVMQVANGWISLFKGATKNSKARRVAMPADVREAVEACCKGKAPDAHVFTWEDGKPIRDFRVTWESACKKAKVPELSFHDLRRSFVRNSQRKGIPATIAMKISGHLTRAVFDDYDVTAEQDLIDAAEKL
jgi:integrase